LNTRTIRHYVDLQARAQPAAPYLIAPETNRVLSYAQLQADSIELGRYLAAQGLAVERLPLLVVPTELLADREGVTHPRFLITWNNVVVETRGGRVRAEGFASLLPEADRRVAVVFRRAGAQLDLLPPLVRSVVLVGGYRCASSHVRAAE